jgi:hypothetical protein
VSEDEKRDETEVKAHGLGKHNVDAHQEPDEEATAGDHNDDDDVEAHGLGKHNVD